MNPAFAHLHGYDAPVELAARQWSDLYPTDERARIESIVLPQLRRLGYWSGEMRGSSEAVTPTTRRSPLHPYRKGAGHHLFGSRCERTQAVRSGAEGE